MASNDSLPRSVLPIPHRNAAAPTTYDAKDPATKFPPIKPLRPPVGAPNVLVILLDDVGFGASSAFGGPCHTPTAERLAAQGLKYTRFHTTAICSPTRAALLSGLVRQGRRPLRAYPPSSFLTIRAPSTRAASLSRVAHRGVSQKPQSGLTQSFSGAT